MSDWDASRYHRVSEPQFDWGQRVIARLRPSAGERILDLGCGTGRLTEEIRRAVPDGPPRVVGLDRSRAMLTVSRSAMGHADFVSCVCIRHHLERLPPDLRDPFTRDLTERAAGAARPFTLDYWRLNIDARKARV